jgi:hypothetical protein
VAIFVGADSGILFDSRELEVELGLAGIEGDSDSRTDNTMTIFLVRSNTNEAFGANCWVGVNLEIFLSYDQM